MKRRDIFKYAGLLAVGSQLPRSVEAQSSEPTWPMFQFDSANTGYNPDASIPTEQVGQQWRTSTLGEVVVSPVIANGMVFVGSRDGKVYAMDVEDGGIQWEYDIGEPIESTPAVSNGSVFVGSTDGYVYSLSTDGDLNWEFETDPDGRNPTISHPICVSSELIFAVSTTSYEEGILYAINKGDGTERWTHNGSAKWDHAPVVGNGSIYLSYRSLGGGRTDDIKSLNVSNGEVQWKVPLSGYISDITLSETSMYISGVEQEGNTIVRDTSDGSYSREITSFSELNVRNINSPSVVGRHIYISLTNDNGNGFLFSFDSITGEEQWRNRLGGESNSSPVVAADTVYVGSDNDEIIAFDRNNGEELWSFSTDGPVRSTSALVEDSLYVGSNDGYVYSLGRVDETSQNKTPTEHDSETSTATPQPQTTTTQQATQAPSSTSTEEATLTPTPADDDPSRGFFRNGGESPFTLLNNPFVLTVGGFFLSVFGIVYQLVAGD